MKNDDILTSISGEKTDTRELWEKFRRPEILSLFREFVYGRRPVERPDGMVFEISDKTEHYNGLQASYERLTVRIGDFSFCVHCYLPENKENIPAFVYVMHEYQEDNSDFANMANNKFVPVGEITGRGYAVFIMPTSGIYPDWEHNDNYRSGVFSAFGPAADKRTGSDWATIATWSWGASRVMDYIETDDRINRENVAVIGHSRGGKTAFWCAANDERFSLAISNASGCMGAAYLKGKTGEHIKDINCTDWFCENFRSFNDNEEMLPVDQHMLLAAIAPRLAYVESCDEDDWSDPAAERLSCRKASEVYEKIYGIPGVCLPDEPIAANEPYHDGNIGYHMKQGSHSISAYDWELYMDFRDKKKR